MRVLVGLLAVVMVMSACGGNDGGGGVTGPDLEAFCSAHERELSAASLEDSNDAIQDQADAAPEDISADAQTVADAFEGVDTAEEIAGISPEVLEARGRVAEYAANEC